MEHVVLVVHVMIEGATPNEAGLRALRAGDALMAVAHNQPGSRGVTTQVKG